MISDAVPAGATYVSGGSYAGGIVSWTVASVAPSDGVAQVSFIVTATATITNSQYRVVTSTEGLGTGFGPPVVTIVGLPSCRALSGVNITGPLTGTVTLYVFTAVITPSDATEPITYTWSPEPDSGQGTASASYRWTTSGVYTITLVAENCGGTASDTHVITVEIERQYVYLPLVLRQFSQGAQAVYSEEAGERETPPRWGESPSVPPRDPRLR